MKKGKKMAVLKKEKEDYGLLQDEKTFRKKINEMR